MTQPVLEWSGGSARGGLKDAIITGVVAGVEVRKEPNIEGLCLNVDPPATTPVVDEKSSLNAGNNVATEPVATTPPSFGDDDLPPAAVTDTEGDIASF